ncbi:hypothetical protein HY522_12555 [bacterium]|nr:hypothetical protein [bacterium]
MSPCVPAEATAGDEYDSGLAYLEDSRAIDIPSALGRFHAALALDPTHAGANVFAAILELAQIVDDPALASLRLDFSNGSDSATISQYLSRVNQGEDIDSIIVSGEGHTYREYSWGTDPTASTAQAILDRILADTFPHVEAHLTAAANANTAFAFPGNLNDDAGGSDTYEIDKTEILFMHSVLLGYKAILTILTSYNLDVTETPENIPDTTSWEEFRANHPNLLTANHSWDTAWKSIIEIDSKVNEALLFLDAKSDSESTTNTDFIRRIVLTDTWDDRFVTDTHLADFFRWHSDTVGRLLMGDTYTFKPNKANLDIGGVAVAPETLFLDPPDRTTLHDLDPPRGRSPEWGEFAGFDATFSGILPGMTAENLFLHIHEPDTYFIVTTTQTIDLNSIYSNSWWLPDNVDIKFGATGAAVTLIRRTTYGSSDYWKLTFTPQETASGHHVRVMFSNPKRLQPFETYKIKNFGHFAGQAVRVVPWTATNGLAADAGSDATTFQNKFSSVLLENAWLNYAADTVAIFQMANAGPQFDTLSTTVVKDVTNDTTLLSANAGLLGWFVAGAPATPTDSTQIEGIVSWLSGDTGTALDQDFVVKVNELLVYPDTNSPFGVFTDQNSIPLPGVTVTFSIFKTPSGATGQDLDTEQTTTDAFGLAYTRLTLGNKPGIYTVKASLSGDSGGGDVLLFATSSGITLWPGDDWFMFALPRQPASASPSTILTTNSRIPSGTWKMYGYDPTTDAISEPSSLKTGRGYWLKTLATELIIVDATNSSALTDTQYLPLDPGWNQVGTPFEQVYSIDWMRVQTAAGNIVDLDTAADSGILVKRFHAYFGASFGYEDCPNASFGRTQCYFYPFEGQWVYANSSCTLVIPPPVSSGSAQGAARITTATYRAPIHSDYSAPSLAVAAAPLAPKKSDDWTIQLIAQSGKYSDLMNVVGVRPQPTDPIFKAPNSPDGVQLAIRSGDARYSSAFLSGVEEPAWEIEVSSGKAGNVTVRAGNVASVPSDVPLTLTDRTTGIETDLRKNSSYTYSSAAGEVRSFSLAAEEPSLLSKVKLPAVCVIRQTFGSDSFLTRALRNLRDTILSHPVGRRLTKMYYGLV